MCPSLHDFGRVWAYFVRSWTSYNEAVYISESEDFACICKSDDSQMIYGDGSIRVVKASVARSRGVKIEATTPPSAATISTLSAAATAPAPAPALAPAAAAPGALGAPALTPAAAATSVIDAIEDTKIYRWKKWFIRLKSGGANVHAWRNDVSHR